MPLSHRLIFFTGSVSEIYEPRLTNTTIASRIVDVLVTAGIMWLMYDKRKEAHDAVPRKVKEMVYEILPKTTLSTMMALCFLFAESAGCFGRNRGNPLVCSDKTYR